MARAARILVVGQSLPFRGELLEHREIETRWATNTREVASQLRRSKVDACIVSPDFDDREVVWLIKRSLDRAPCLVLVDDPKDRAKWPPDTATAVVPVGEVESVVLLLAQHTGLRLARYPRADIVAPVMVDLHGRVYERVTKNLSLSGVAICDFPKAPIGARVDLVMTLGGRAVNLRAKVIRSFDEDGDTCAGLTFIDVPEGARELIHAEVQASLQQLPQQWEIDELFGDLVLDDDDGAQALRTFDVARSPLPAFVPRTRDLEIPAVCAVLDGAARQVPPWLAQLAEGLTGVEIAAARGQPAPPWAMDVLKLRINLARVRHTFPGRPPPSALIDDAYRMFERLHRETAHETGSILAQVRRIRTDLLRSMVMTPKTADMEPA
ncbi:MAG: PilZ domain-containing protein [Deltaproteobacteria bacterium]|nr:PilZ domain-containing protein [Deltaproteobacteria bacterium]